MSSPPLSPHQEKIFQQRRDLVFLILAGIFLGSMTMLNILGITRFIQLGPFTVAVGVLPYPITFLCTDLVSEFYGKKRASQMVWVGLGLNIFVVGIVILGKSFAAPLNAAEIPPWQFLNLAESVSLPDGSTLSGRVEFFDLIHATTIGIVIASMAAYLTAQFCDVYLFHFWKKLTNGKHLWLRNNGSTLISQLVDSIMVMAITFGASFLAGETSLKTILTLIWGTYVFKLVFALIDTLPIYLCVKGLSGYLGIDPLRVESE